MSAKTLVIVSSRTGNTRIVAHAVADALGAVLATTEEFTANPALADSCESVMLGFWNDRGMAPEDMRAAAGLLRGKTVGCFATMGGDPESERARAWMTKVSESLVAEGVGNRLATTFLVRGRIDPALFARMTAAMGGVVTPEREARRRAAETHPDRLDLLAAEAHFRSVFAKDAAPSDGAAS